MKINLNNKNLNIVNVAKKALKDKEFLSELLEGIISKNETKRSNSFKILMLLSQKHPGELYSKWDHFVEMLDSKNAFFKFMAVQLIANLTKIDKENKFKKIFGKYYNLLNDSVIVAGHITANSGKIAKAKPELRSKITNKLLNIDKTKQKHKDLIKAGAIESFSEYFKESNEKEKIIEFVKKQLNCESPKTRTIAKNFLKKWHIS
jgi:hypothetical protein